MNDACKRMAILYGKLGLQTQKERIEARYPGIEAAAGALTIDSLGELLLVIFGKPNGEVADFLEHFRDDPTFDVRPSDKEAGLLATAVADYAMTERSEIAGDVALCLVASSVGGIRQPAVSSGIVELAHQTLVTLQSEEAAPPALKGHLKAPQAFNEKLTAFKDTVFQPNQLVVIRESMASIIDTLQSYIESVSMCAKYNENSLLAHIKKLEDETRMHWWVVGGWSPEANCFFRELNAAQAAIQAGWELANNRSFPLGLHGAPGLLNQVLVSGRDTLPKITLSEASKAPKLAWRKSNFGEIAKGHLAPLLPISTMLGLSAESDDEDDWKPAFKRKTGLDPAMEIDPVHLAMQVYCERLVGNKLQG